MTVRPLPAPLREFPAETAGTSEGASRNAMRAASIAQRNLQDSATIAAWTAQLCARLERGWPRPPGKIVGFCWPMKNEPDLRPQLVHWCKQGATVVLPVVIEPGHALIFRPWPQSTTTDGSFEKAAMVPDRYGIPTPVSGPELLPDALLLPLNAFDPAGYRIGYGGGFFDRTVAALAAAGKRPVCIGVGFEIGAVTDTFPQAHDQRLDWIVTEARTMRCR